MTEAVKVLLAKLPEGFDGSAKFVIEGEGAILLDQTGVRKGDGPAEVTMTATTDVFRAILDGRMNPTAAFMQGKLAIDGSMGMAMKLGAALS